MTSIFARALGSDFERLHPCIQARFGFDSSAGYGSVGRGVMDEIWRGGAWTVPFLATGARRHIMFPDTGRDVPFTIENHAFVDDFGRETISMIRTFELARRTRRFDAWMVFSEGRARIVDYLGSHEELAVDLDVSVAPSGGIRLVSGGQRLYTGSFGIPVPLAISGVADVVEWFVEAIGRYRITVDVRNRRFGRLFGYSGTFDVEWPAVVGGRVPAHVLPLRQERRD
jgi:hypothetical protein